MPTQPIIYDVAVSVDGYIAGPSDDVSRFAMSGPVVDDYSDRLSSYHTAIMGAATYAFGYRFGMMPGQNPYPHLRTHVFSNSLEIPDGAEIDQVKGPLVERVKALQDTADGPIYLVGGGRFSAALLRNGLIDRLRLKRAPIFLGGGVPLFAPGLEPFAAICIETKVYDDGYVFQEFDLRQNAALPGRTKNSP